MKKTLIAAAVAAAVAAPAANAGVVIYGKIHVGIDYVDQDASGTFVTTVPTTIGEEPVVIDSGTFSESLFKGWEVNNHSSRIGFKGSEDLGNGLKAIWKMENSVRITDTSSTPWSHDGSKGHWASARNAYIGLASDWGTFLYGRHDTPYKMGFYSTGIDMLGDSIIDVNGLYGITEVRADDAIAYVSPNWNGLTLAAAIVPGEGFTDSEGKVYDGLADNYSVSAMYSNNGLKLAVGYEELNQGLAATTGVDSLCATSDCTNFMVGAGYSMNAFDVSAVYIQQEYGESVDSDIWALSAAYTFGNNKIIGTYGQNDYGSDDFSGYGLALQHMFSKRTSAYLAYASQSDLPFSATLTETVGEVTETTTATGFSDTSAFSFGMIHKF